MQNHKACIPELNERSDDMLLTFALSFLLSSFYFNSKKGLPLPPSLPVPLKAFLVNAPAVPGAAPAASVSPAAVPPAAGGFAPLPPAAGGFNATAPMPAQSPPAKVSISSAFDFPSPAPAPLEDSKFSSPGFAPSVPAPAAGGFAAPSHTVDVRICILSFF